MRRIVNFVTFPDFVYVFTVTLHRTISNVKDTFCSKNYHLPSDRTRQKWTGDGKCLTCLWLVTLPISDAMPGDLLRWKSRTPKIALESHDLQSNVCRSLSDDYNFIATFPMDWVFVNKKKCKPSKPNVKHHFVIKWQLEMDFLCHCVRTRLFFFVLMWIPRSYVERTCFCLRNWGCNNNIIQQKFIRMPKSVP